MCKQSYDLTNVRNKTGYWKLLEYIFRSNKDIYPPAAVLMYQSIPVVNRRPLRIRTSFLPSPPQVFLKKVLPRRPGFRSGQIVPEIDKNLQCISILVNAFKKLTRMKGKTLVFVHNNCICLLQHLN